MKFIISEEQLYNGALLWMDKHFHPDKLEIVDFPDGVFYKKNGKIVMEKNDYNKNFYFDYEDIWSVFWHFYGYDFGEIQSILEKWLKKVFDLEDYRPRYATDW